MRQLLVGAAVLPCSLAQAAGDPFGSAPTPHGPRAMLYVSVPLGAPGASRVYGLRLEQTPVAPPTRPDLPVYAFRPRDIVDFQVRSMSDVRVLFARRLSWDLSRLQSGPSVTQQSFAIRLPLRPVLLPAPARALP